MGVNRTLPQPSRYEINMRARETKRGADTPTWAGERLPDGRKQRRPDGLWDELERGVPALLSPNCTHAVAGKGVLRVRLAPLQEEASVTPLPDALVHGFQTRLRQASGRLPGRGDRAQWPRPSPLPASLPTRRAARSRRRSPQAGPPTARSRCRRRCARSSRCPCRW